MILRTIFIFAGDILLVVWYCNDTDGKEGKKKRKDRTQDTTNLAE